MHAERIPSAAPPAVGRPSGLIRTRHTLAVCVVCGYGHGLTTSTAAAGDARPVRTAARR